MAVDKLKGLILAAGLPGGELARTIAGRPPCALPIGNWPLVQYGLEALCAAGTGEIAAVASPDAAPELARLGIEVIEAPHDASMVEALLLARPFLAGAPALVHRADALVLSPVLPLLEAWESEQAELGLLVGADALDDVGDAAPLRVAGTESSALCAERSALAFVLSPAALERAAASEQREGRRRLSSITDLARVIVADGARLTVRRAPESWCYRDDVDELLEANRLVLDALGRDVAGVDLSSSRVEGRVVIHPSAVVERTTIRGPVVIGAGAMLIDTFVGPYTAIGEHARLEGAEVEHSIVLAGASIRHVGHRLASSIVGREATVRRDFGLPAGLRLRVGRGADVALA